MKHESTVSKQFPAILLVDSITQVEAADQGKIVVSASHGGISSARFALEVPLALVFFNDWGIGKDEAGIAALAMLVDSGVPSACISQNSARIGDAQYMWEHGLSLVSISSQEQRASLWAKSLVWLQLISWACPRSNRTLNTHHAAKELTLGIVCINLRQIAN